MAKIIIEDESGAIAQAFECDELDLSCDFLLSHIDAILALEDDDEGGELDDVDALFV